MIARTVWSVPCDIIDPILLRWHFFYWAFANARSPPESVFVSVAKSTIKLSNGCNDRDAFNHWSDYTFHKSSEDISQSYPRKSYMSLFCVRQLDAYLFVCLSTNCVSSYATPFCELRWTASLLITLVPDLYRLWSSSITCTRYYPVCKNVPTSMLFLWYLVVTFFSIVISWF